MAMQKISTDEEPNENDKVCGIFSWHYLLIAIVLSVLLIIVSKMAGPEFIYLMESSVDFFSTGSPQACALYVSIYVASCMVGVPLTLFEVMSGYLFGFALGFAVDMIGQLTASSLSFFVARFLFSYGCDLAPKNPVLKGVGRAVDERGLGFLVLFNLLYVPVAIKNFGLGFVPEVQFWQFFVSIFIVEIPMATIWAFVGSTARTNGTDLEDVEEGGASREWVGLAVICLAVPAFIMVLKMIGSRVQEEIKRQKVSEEVSTDAYNFLPLPPPGA